MKKKLLFLTALILCSLTSIFAQVPIDEEEEIYAIILDSMNRLYDFQFYNENLAAKETEQLYENLDDTITILNYKTYEQITKLAKDWIPYFDSLNLIETNLFEERKDNPEGLFLIQKLKEEQISRYVDLQKYVELESYPDVQLLGEMSDHMLKKKRIGRFNTIENTEDHRNALKYVYKALCSFSGIEFDSEDRYCIVEMGFHYRIRGGRPSGGGQIFILERQVKSFKIIGSIGLWEE